MFGARWWPPLNRQNPSGRPHIQRDDTSAGTADHLDLSDGQSSS